MISLRNRKQNLSEKQKNKISEIREALKNNDINGLRNLSKTEGGFVTSELRKLCWPFLLHVDVSKIRISEKNEIISKNNEEIISNKNETENSSKTENEQQNSIEKRVTSTDSEKNIKDEIDKDIKENFDTLINNENITKDNSNTIDEQNDNEKLDNNETKNVEENEKIDNVNKIDNNLAIAESKNGSIEQQQQEKEEIKQSEKETNEQKPIEIQDVNVNENEHSNSNENNDGESKIKNDKDVNNKIQNNKEIHELQDDLNSETLKDENNENIENIVQENTTSNNNNNNNEDFTENNHTDDDGDDVLFEGDLDVKLNEIHSSYYNDNEENKGIFDSSCSSLNLLEDEQEIKENEETKKIIAKNLILENEDEDDDPDRMDKLKQIENESKYRDKRQIMLDVNRAFVHFPKGLKAKEKTIKQIELSNVIMYSLKDHSYLHYYQGYHDICSLLLLVLGEDIAKSCAEVLALYWLREYMKETLEPTLEVMSLLYPILKYADPKIYKLVYNNMIPPYFSISWVITWCIHDLRDTSEMERIFDFFISNNPIMPIYFAAAVILAQKDQLYKRFPQILNEEANNEEDENDPETSMPNFSVVHQFLTNLLPIATQTKDVTVDGAIELAWNLYEQFPVSFLMKKESIKLNPLCCVKRYFDDCEKILPNKPFNKEEIVKLLKEEERLNLEKTMATPNSKNDHLKKIQEKADIIGNYLSQRITLWTIATTLILVTAIILTHEFSKSYYL
ncbi:RabGAP/TBC [Piromyces finnis]|uniref:RabGAP/TBC n=1 Tax=Piromyces finnis TaxID=1754191 RepID=A0A1Y1V8G4_9FUNG|nr:RabGAP/TBC [Piromyces finnis]|eukprot:ORX49748.1 RabGAP/TBC [Piromyces finnis]